MRWSFEGVFFSFGLLRFGIRKKMPHFFFSVVVVVVVVVVGFLFQMLLLLVFCLQGVGVFFGG